MWGGVRSDTGVHSGKYYYECVMRDDGLCRVGWSSAAASHDLGTDAHGYGFGGTGRKSNARNFILYGEPFGKGDVIGCFVDLDDGSVSWSKNGKFFGEGFKLPPKFSGTLYAAVCMKNAELSVNFGETPFKYPFVQGYAGLHSAPEQHRVVNNESAAESDAAPRRLRAGGGPLAIVLEPAKDLAEQVFGEIDRLKRYVVAPKVRQVLLIGGADARKQERVLRDGVDIVVGTLHRVMDFVTSGRLDCSNVRLFVLDEADQLVGRDNLDTLMKIFNRLPKGAGVQGRERLQVAFFSATLHSDEITRLSSTICQHPTWVDLKGKDTVPDTVDHVIVNIDPRLREHRAIAASAESSVIVDGVHTRDPKGGDGELQTSQRVKLAKPAMLVKLIDSLNMEQAIIFCRTNVDCNNLERYLTERGGGRRFGGKVESGKENPYSCCVLAGMRNMSERRRNLQAFRDGDVRFMICTDVAARGIDIQDLPYVVNMTLPDVDQIEDYIHRIGRVGRADRMGLAVSLVSSVREKVWYHRCKNRGIGCTNTKLLSKGGCCKWFDEQDLLRRVKARLGDGTNIEAMVETPEGLRLPAGIGEGVTYGEIRKDVTQASEHVIALAPAVTELATLEVAAQTSFYNLQLTFGEGASGAGSG